MNIRVFLAVFLLEERRLFWHYKNRHGNIFLPPAGLRQTTMYWAKAKTALYAPDTWNTVLLIAMGGMSHAACCLPPLRHIALICVCVCMYIRVLCIIYPFACPTHNVLAKQSADFLCPASPPRTQRAISACFKTAKNFRVYLFLLDHLVFHLFGFFAIGRLITDLA